MWARVGPATGIAGWLIAIAGYVVHGYPKSSATNTELVRWMSSTDKAVFTAGIFTEAVGILLLMAFFAWLSSAVAGPQQLNWLPRLSFAMFVVWGAAAILGNSMWIAMLDAGQRGADPQVLATVRDVAQELFNTSYLFFGLAMVVIGIVAIQSRTLPAWLSWPAVVIGLGLAVPQTVDYAGLAQIIWTIAVAIRSLVVSPNRITAVV